jgi:hypothetical protein
LGLNIMSDCKSHLKIVVWMGKGDDYDRMGRESGSRITEARELSFGATVE